MCYNCGCFIPDDDMGHQDNITDHTFEHLAEKWKKSPEETKKIVFDLIEQKKTNTNSDVQEMFEKASKAWGQPITEAQNYTHKLLKQQLK